jgi:hypothetical protein
MLSIILLSTYVYLLLYMYVHTIGDKVYNLVVIGAGSGGLVSAAGAAGVYAKVSNQHTIM